MGQKNNPIKASGKRMEALVVADISEFKRPPCPECNSTNIESRGTDWMCRDCGRKYTKIRRFGRQCVSCPYWKDAH